MDITCDDICKLLQNLISQEVLVAHKCLQVGLWEHIAEYLEALRSNLVQTHIKLFKSWSALALQ